MRIIKKYSNRRLYDTATSRYITLDELTVFIRDDQEVQVIDAKSGEDLTRATLAQIVADSRGAMELMPLPLLNQLIRMDDEALQEFMGRYMSWALQMYLQSPR